MLVPFSVSKHGGAIVSILDGRLRLCLYVPAGVRRKDITLDDCHPILPPSVGTLQVDGIVNLCAFMDRVPARNVSRLDGGQRSISWPRKNGSLYLVV